MASAMDPQQALHTIAQVRRPREHLTAQAVGQIWMVWGLAIGLIGFASQAAFHAEYAGGWIDPFFIVVGGGIGAIVTNAVWRAHALERDPQHRASVAWALGVGGLLVLGMALLLSNRIGPVLRDPALMMAPLALAGAYGAAAITVATRRRVSAVPGSAAAVVLLMMFVFARFVFTAQRTPALDFLGNGALSVTNILAFTLVGWLHFRRG